MSKWKWNLCKLQEAGGSKPYIVVKPEDQAEPLNRRAVFKCEAIGRPTPTARYGSYRLSKPLLTRDQRSITLFRWLRNGRELPESTRYRFEEHDGVYKFMIKEVPYPFTTESYPSLSYLSHPTVPYPTLPYLTYPTVTLLRFGISTRASTRVISAIRTEPTRQRPDSSFRVTICIFHTTRKSFPPLLFGFKYGSRLTHGPYNLT